MANHMAADPSRRSYNRENELHVRAIDRLVHELGISAEVVNNTYRELLDELKKENRARAFLPILVSRGVKERLLQQQ